MNKEPVVGFVVPLKTKLVILLASLMSTFCFGYIGYKLEIYPAIFIAVILLIIFMGAAFFKTWICVDEARKNIYVKKRFYLTWNNSYPYENKYLYVRSSSDISPTFSYQEYSPDSITHDIYLSSDKSKRGELIFSSNKKDDYYRVMNYLSFYIEEDKI